MANKYRLLATAALFVSPILVTAAPYHIPAQLEVYARPIYTIDADSGMTYRHEIQQRYDNSPICNNTESHEQT